MIFITHAYRVQENPCPILRNGEIISGKLDNTICLAVVLLKDKNIYSRKSNLKYAHLITTSEENRGQSNHNHGGKRILRIS